MAESDNLEPTQSAVQTSQDGTQQPSGGPQEVTPPVTEEVKAEEATEEEELEEESSKVEEEIPDVEVSNELEELNKVECNCPTVETDTGTEGTTKPTWIVPAIGTVGTFTFASPFDNLLLPNVEYEVKAIRSIQELVDSQDKPYENIYQTNGLTEKDYKTDADWKVPIIVLSTGTGTYYYVPASKLKSQPKVTGVKYQQQMMVINLGYLPLDIDVSLAKDIIIEDIRGTLGITSTVETIKTSAVQLISEDDDTSFKRQLTAKKTTTKSYRTQYNLLLQRYNSLFSKFNMLKNCFTNHIRKGLAAVKVPEVEEEVVQEVKSNVYYS